jgi:hypothetical protein
VVALPLGLQDGDISLDVQRLALILRQSFALLHDPLSLGGSEIEEFKTIDSAAMPPDQGRHAIAHHRLQFNGVTQGKDSLIRADIPLALISRLMPRIAA